MSKCCQCGSECDADICEQCRQQFEYEQHLLEESLDVQQYDSSNEPF